MAQGPSAHGNRITDVTTGGASISRTQYYSNTSNRLNDIWENGASLRVYTYDGAGNTLTETRPGEAFAYTYNKRNRLSSVTRNGSLWGTYVYNAFEQLVSRTSPAPAAPLGTVHYIHDLDGHLIAEADGATGAVLRDYIWLPALAPRSLGVGGNDNEVQDLPLAVIDGVNTATPVTSFIHTDHLGRPTRMTNAAKATVWQAVWTPWGEAQSMTGSTTQNLRFPGQYFQIETGLNYNHHRQYDPVTGRYTQPDPLGFVDGPSVYAYAGNSPWMNVDREGRYVDTILDVGFVLHDLYRLFRDGQCNRRENLTALGLDVAAILIPGATGLGQASRGIKLIRHHSVPRQVLKKLPPHVAKHPLVRGARGKPNIRKVEERLHKIAHSSPKNDYTPGGDYNKEFFEKIEMAGGINKVTPEQIREIANQLMKKYFGQ